MNNTAIKVENLSKLYRLGEVGTGTISHDLNRWWAKLRGKQDPFAKVGQINDRTQKAQKGEQVWALQDINFEVQQGEVLGVIGKNGAGKSTLLKLLSKITAPTTGSIKARGRIASLLEVGTGMHPEMTGKENVYLNGTILGMTKREIDKKFDDIMDFAGCAKYADTPVKRYSSGMKVRLGFAVAAFLEPEILIVDEVLAVGDAEFQKRAIGKMQEVSQEGGRTVLFVSHNMGSIAELCAQSLVLHNGKVSFKGKTADAIEKYLYTYESFEKEAVFTNETPNRRGSGQVKFLKASIIDTKGDYCSTFAHSEDIIFNVFFKSPSKAILNLTLLIYNQKGELVSHLLNYNDKIEVVAEPGVNNVEVIIPNNLFNEGKYLVTLRIADRFRVLQDLIEKCIAFNIDSTPNNNIRCISSIRYNARWVHKNLVEYE